MVSPTFLRRSAVAPIVMSFSFMLSAEAPAQVSFTSDVQPIFDAGCVNRGCHPGGGAPFSLQATVSYMNLVSVPVSNPTCGATLRVTPFDADASVLYLRISGQTPCSRMPLVGDTLSLSDQNTIRDWIDEGAMNDVTAVDEDDQVTPYQLALYQNYPNPFNPSTEIRFSTIKQERVGIEIFDLLGRRVRILLDEGLDPGEYHVRWDGRDDAGNPVESGVYISRMRAGTFSETRKMLLLR